MACNDLAVRLPRLRSLTMHHVLEIAKDESDERNNMFTDYFCGAVAARWRANSVFAAQPYKTSNEQAAVQQAVHDAHVRLRDYAIQNNRVVFLPQHPPRTLKQLRSGMQPTHLLICKNQYLDKQPNDHMGNTLVMYMVAKQHH